MKRRNSIGISDEELEEYMTLLADSFSSEWLERVDSHPLQILWKRNDELATNELFTIAYSIKELSGIDPQWIKKQIQTIKGKNKNNYQGAIFELVALNMMHNSADHPVKPAKINQAGFDGLITRNNNTEIRVSIKNYGVSSFQKTFEGWSKKIESKVIELLKKYSYPPSQILIDFPDSYPNDRDWKMLEDNLDSIFKSQRNAAEPFNALVEPLDAKKELTKDNSRTIFFIIISQFDMVKSKFHEKFLSYTLMISGRFHQNEHLNLYSKIDEACANLLKHSATENANVTNSLFLHLPETVSLAQCSSWLDDYFEQFPDKQISYVYLYQPTVATILEENKTGICHCFKFYVRQGRTLNGNYKFTIPVGIVQNESTNLMFLALHPDGTTQTIPLENRYVYQHGEHFMKMTPGEDGKLTGNIQKLGSGVDSKLVIELPGQKEMSVIQGRFAPRDELIIL